MTRTHYEQKVGLRYAITFWIDVLIVTSNEWTMENYVLQRVAGDHSQEIVVHYELESTRYFGIYLVH